MDWSDPRALAAFVNAIAPSIIGGLIALAGVIVLFALQQSALRRAERRARMDRAADHLMETLEAARLAFTGKKVDHEYVSDMLTKSWRFAWLLERKERPVADWAFAMLWRALQGSMADGVDNRVSAMQSVFTEIMVKLHAWHTRETKVSWFAADLARINAEKAPEPTAALQIDSAR